MQPIRRPRSSRATGIPGAMVLTSAATRSFAIESSGALRRVAVRLDEADDATHHRIRTIVNGALARRWIIATPAICVIADAPETSITVERDTHALGWTLVSAATSTDVVARLRDPSLRFEAAIVDANLERVNAPAVLRHLADEYPHTRRVLVAATKSAEADAEVASGRAHAFVQLPWQRDVLLCALGASFGSRTPIPTDKL